MSVNYDIYLWQYPESNKLIKIEKVPEDKVEKYTHQWFDKDPMNDCMIVDEHEDFAPCGPNVTIPSKEWIKHNFVI